MQIELDFLGNYTFDLPVDLPGDGRRILRFGPSTSRREKDGFLVRIEPEQGEPWYGVFEFGVPNSYEQSNGAYKCPNPDEVCIVSNGCAYVVNVVSPEHFYLVRSHPVIEVNRSVTNNLLLFSDFGTITAIGTAGQIWQSKQLAMDGAYVSSINDQEIRGHGNCLCFGKEPDSTYDFILELKTGSHTGGWPPNA